MCEWISVKDRMPERGVWVLTYAPESDDDWDSGIWMAAWAPYADTGWVGDDRNIGNVTHWMPLPEPPKE